MIPKMRRVSPTMDSTNPRRSSRCGWGLRLSGTMRQMPNKPMRTIGTLIRNTAPQSLPVIQFDHWGCCRIRPPSTGPSATAAPTAPAHAPMALPRSWGGKTTVMMARVVGRTAAPPTPMSARKPISMAGVDEKAQATDATAKMTSPITNTFLRPMRSPSTPQVKRSAAKTRM